MQEHHRERQVQQTLNSSGASRKRLPLARWFSALAAVVLIGILVGSLILVLNTARHSKSHTAVVVKHNTHTGSGGTPLPTPPHPITGGKCTLDTTVSHPQQSKSSVPGLYVFALNDQSDNVLYRYDAHTKEVVWSKKLCTNFQSSGTVEQNGVLYLAGADWTNESTSGSVSYLYALNETDGSVIWGTKFPADVASATTDLGVIETPTIANGIVYVAQRSGIVYALDAANGGQLWTFNAGRNAWATTSDGMGGSIVDPSSIQVVNGIAYGSIVDRLFALDAKSGKELWMHSLDNALNINQAPVIVGGSVYLTAFVPGYGTVMHPDTYIYAFDAQTGAQQWVTKKLRGYINGPTAAFNGKVYVMSYESVWYTLSAASGAIESQRTLPNNGVSSPVAINGVLYSITDTTLAVLNTDGSARWSVPVTGKYPFIDDVRGGIIYVSGRGSGIYAYSASNGSLLWHYEGYLPQPDDIVLVTIVS